MDTHVPPLYNLPPELAHHVFKHLSKREKQQFALCCKHAHLCALAAIRSLILGHKCLSSGNSGKLKTVRHKHAVPIMVGQQNVSLALTRSVLAPSCPADEVLHQRHPAATHHGRTNQTVGHPAGAQPTSPPSFGLPALGALGGCVCAVGV